MDQATATIVAAVIGLSGTITAAIIAILWKARPPQRHIYEYRVLHHLETEREPWLQGKSWLPRAVRGIGWAVSSALMFIGISSLFFAANIWLNFPEAANRNLKIWAVVATAILVLLAGYWIAKRIEVSRELDDADDE